MSLYGGVVMDKQELKYQVALIDMQIGGLELRLGLTHGLSESEKQSIRDQISSLRDKRLYLKGAFRLS